MGSLEEPAPEVECAVCFNHYNNASHPPKVLPCRHTFCLECLICLSFKSQPPDAIQCPLCRHCTRLPASGLPRLHNNLAILACLPERMERACSVCFSRAEGQLWVWPQASCAAGRPQSHVSSISHSSEVGCLPRQEMWPRQVEQRDCWSLLHKPLCLILLVMVAVVTITLLVSSILFLTVPHSRSVSHNLTASSPSGALPRTP